MINSVNTSPVVNLHHMTVSRQHSAPKIRVKIIQGGVEIRRYLRLRQKLRSFFFFSKCGCHIKSVQQQSVSQEHPRRVSDGVLHDLQLQSESLLLRVLSSIVVNDTRRFDSKF